MLGKVIVFSTGKMISVGTKTVEAAVHDLEHAAERLVCLGLAARSLAKFSTQNIVATADLEQDINLEKIAIAVPGAVYEPEVFPGAIWHPRRVPRGYRRDA